MELRDIAALVQPGDRRAVLLVLDGLGGLPRESGGKTELETARTPHLDRLVRHGGCGLHVPVAPGVTPGSGPGHLALFGYDPLRYRVGRGVLEALGVGYELGPGEVAARGNFCTLDEQGRVADRRAGRIATEDAAPLVELLDGIRIEGAEVTVRAVKEHRFLLVLRFPEPVEAEVSDTDPGRAGEPPGEPRPLGENSREVAEAAARWLEEARDRLATEAGADMVLLRGFSTLPDWPSFPEVFGMSAVALAAYPMYRGVARLVGMEARSVSDGLGPLLEALPGALEEHEFVFLHVKGTDRAGEDGDFEGKVALIEEVDGRLPEILGAGPDVLLVTGDHSTPAEMRRHSWHPVPFLLYGGEGRTGVARSFGESACSRGIHGTVRGCELMPMLAARAGRFGKFGA